jgi:N6-L-threonylcarbamoyladenine synthase
MNKSIIALGVESSCDETSLGLIKFVFKNKPSSKENFSSEKLVLVTETQQRLHKDFGGVVPEIAARAHSEKIDLCFKNVIKQSNIVLDDIDLICVTAGPGLIGGLSFFHGQTYDWS